MTMQEYGAVDEFKIMKRKMQISLIKRNRALDEVEIPYQTLEQDDIESIRITENSGLSFIFTF